MDASFYVAFLDEDPGKGKNCDFWYQLVPESYDWTFWRKNTGKRAGKGYAYFTAASGVEAINEEMLRKTDADYAPWTVINAAKKKEAKVAVYQAVIQAMEEAVARKELEEKGSLEKKTEMKRETAESILAETDLSKSMPKEVYEERLFKDRLRMLITSSKD